VTSYVKGLNFLTISVTVRRCGDDFFNLLDRLISLIYPLPVCVSVERAHGAQSLSICDYTCRLVAHLAFDHTRNQIMLRDMEAHTSMSMIIFNIDYDDYYRYQ
jgi:hypothetical protein